MHYIICVNLKDSAPNQVGASIILARGAVLNHY